MPATPRRTYPNSENEIPSSRSFEPILESAEGLGHKQLPPEQDVLMESESAQLVGDSLIELLTIDGPFPSHVSTGADVASFLGTQPIAGDYTAQDSPRSRSRRLELSADGCANMFSASFASKLFGPPRDEDELRFKPIFPLAGGSNANMQRSGGQGETTGPEKTVFAFSSKRMSDGSTSKAKDASESEERPAKRVRFSRS